MPARRASLLAVLACVASLAGCSGAGEGAGVVGGGPAGTGAHDPLVLLAPLRQEAVQAQARGRHVRVSLNVVGLASPGARVVVSGAGCAPGCAVAATADGGGTWTATLPMSLRGGAVTASLAAAYDEALPGDRPARVTVPLQLAEVPRTGAVRKRTPVAKAPATPAGGAENEGPSVSSAQSPASLLPPAVGGGGVRTLVLIGDSLSVTQQPLLEAALPGWSISSSARVGRPLAEGMQILAATQLPPGSILAVGLFTNDDPGRTADLQAAVRESLRRVGARGCAIWATIAAPPKNGRTFDAANRLLNELATREPRLRIVPWEEAALVQPALLSGDRVHPVPAGAQLRAALFAQAARSCP